MKRFLVLTLTTIMLFTLVIGCFNLVLAADDELVIALVPKATTSQWFLPAKEGVEKAFTEAGKNFKLLYVSGSSETDVAGQIYTIENLISRNVDGIIISATDGKALIGAVNHAIESGIPVVAFDSDIPESNRLAYFGTNNIDTGYAAGKALAELIGGKGKVAVIMGVLGATNEMDRLTGFKKAMKEYPEIEIVNVIDTQGDRSKAAEAAANVLTSNPDIAGLFGNTGIAAPGMAQGVVEAGFAGKVKLVGMDDVPDNIRFAKEGVMHAIVAQSPYNMGYYAAKTLIKYLDTGEKPEKEMNYVDASILYAEDLK